MNSEIEVTNGRSEVAEVVHDLKAPLSTIAFEIELMDAQPPCCDTGSLSQSIGRIRRNVRFLDRLIYDLLDVCTLSSSELALKREPCDLAGLLATAIDRLVPTSQRHRVVLDATETTTVVIDELRIERVVANLLDNALKYTPSSSGIIVRLTKTARDAQISVCDGGPGLSATDLAHVFEPYRRAASSRERPGTGLGLYVSKRIVEAHGGTIGVESVRGIGARFYFALPLG